MLCQGFHQFELSRINDVYLFDGVALVEKDLAIGELVLCHEETDALEWEGV